jgi:hypothetical protein
MVNVGKDSAGRLERIAGEVQVNEGKVTLLGCEIREGITIMALDPGFRKGEVRAEGCAVYLRLTIDNAPCTFRHCLIPRGNLLSVKGDGDVTLEGNRFDGGTLQVRSRAELRSNHFIADRFTPVGALEGGQIRAEENYFYFPGRAAVRRNDDGSEEAPPAVFTYGLASIGRNSQAYLKNNRFVSRKTWGQAHDTGDGGAITEEEGNTRQVVSPTEGAGIVEP